jgi:hypothetical protein
MKTFFVLCVLALGISSCLRYDTRLVIDNRSSATISLQDCPTGLPAYPNLNKKEYYLRAALSPGDSTGLRPEGDWETYINSMPNKKLNLCLFDYKTLLQYDNIDSLIAHHAYVMKRVGMPELTKTKWRVVIK